MNFKFDNSKVTEVEHNGSSMFVSFSNPSETVFPRCIAVSDDELSICWKNNDSDCIDRNKVDAFIFFKDGAWEVEIDMIQFMKIYKYDMSKSFKYFFFDYF